MKLQFTVSKLLVIFIILLFCCIIAIPLFNNIVVAGSADSNAITFSGTYNGSRYDCEAVVEIGNIKKRLDPPLAINFYMTNSTSLPVRVKYIPKNGEKFYFDTAVSYITLTALDSNFNPLSETHTIPLTSSNKQYLTTEFVQRGTFNVKTNSVYKVYCQFKIRRSTGESDLHDFTAILITDTQGPEIEYTVDNKPLTTNITNKTPVNVELTDRIDLKNITVNGSSYPSSFTLNNEGTYTIVATDIVGNSSTYTFIIDKTAPTGTLTGVTNGGITNSSVSFTWTESGATATLNGAAYTKGATISAERQHTIVLTDRAGNSRTYTFTIDKTPPTGTLTGVTNGSITNGNVSFTWTESNVTAALNGSAYTKGTTISTEGEHTIILSDRAGNSSTYTFIIDKTAPTGTLTGVKNGGYTNTNVSFSWTESGATATLNDKAYNKGTTISAEKQHTIVLTDRAGNSRTYTFTIDKTPPTGTLAGVTNGGITNSNVSFTWTESNVTAALNGSAYTKGATISTGGEHTIILTDRAGNRSTYTFTIDKTPPTGTLTGVTDGSYTNKNVSFSWTESGATATLNDKAYNKGTTISAEGEYTIVLTDRAGNSRTYTFTIDKTAPTGTLTGVANGGFTNSNVSFSWTESNVTSTLNGAAYTKGATISAEGQHTIILTDRAGNRSTYTFTIDRTPPSGYFTSESGELLTSTISKDGIKFIANKSSTNINISYNSSVNANVEPYNTSINIRGKENNRITYTFYLIDQIGNTNSYTFTIDRVAPIIEFKNRLTQKPLLISPNSVFYCNQDIIYSYSSDCIITINDAAASGNILAAPTGVSESYIYINIVNSLGNKNNYTICFDTIADTRNFDILYTSTSHYINRWYESYDYNPGSNSYVRSSLYSFSNYADAQLFAYNREEGQAEYHSAYLGGTISTTDGRYVDSTDITPTLNQSYYIYRSIESTNKLIAYFNLSNLQTALNYYANISITQKSIPSTPAPAYPGKVLSNVPAQNIDTIDNSLNLIVFYSRKQIAFSNVPSGTIFINSIQCSYDNAASMLANNTANIIEEYDRAGNLCKYIIYIDTESPNFIARNTANILLENLNSDLNGVPAEIYYNSSFILTASDIDTKGWKLTVAPESGDEIVIFGDDINSSFSFSESGIYTLTLTDRAGNSIIKTLYLFLEKPIINLSENTDNLTDALLSFNINIDTLFKKNILYNLVITLTTEDDARQLTVDDSGIIINTSTLSYLFLVNGTYHISVTDMFGEIVELSYTFVKNAPTGTLYDINNSILLSNSYTKRSVYFTWKDEAALAYINGIEYIKGSLITDEGVYNIELRDSSGNVTLYNITIDKTAPRYILTGVLANKSTNSDVIISWDSITEFGTIGQIKANTSSQYSAYTKDSPITAEGSYDFLLTDLAGNTTIFSFTIDKTPPIIYINSYPENQLITTTITNKNINFTWSKNATATLNGVEYKSGTTVRQEGSYILTVTDNNGNSSACRIIIDKTLNDGSLVGVLDGGFTNSNVSFIWTDSDATATLNGAEYLSGTTIEEEGEYTIILTDLAGNTKTYTFTIDKTAPIGILNGVADNGFTNNNVSFSWTERSATATLNGEAYLSGSTIRAEGEHTIILSDRAGNSSTYTFIIDKTAPVGILIGAENGGFTNNNVSFTWTESGATATLNGAAYISGDTIEQESEYTIILTDCAGNSSTYTFVIDKTAPVGELEGVTDAGCTNSNVSFTWTERTATATLNGAAYVSGTTIRAEGEYTIVLTDRAGNSSTYTFTIDRMPPVGTLIGVENGGFTSLKVSFVWEDLTARCALNGAEYLSGTTIEEEGEYTIILIDRAGNSSEYSFTIDKTAPMGELEGVTDAGCTNGNVSFTWTERSATATLNGEAYLSGTTIRAEGEYTIVLTDRAGNSSTYTFIIDRSTPGYYLINENGLVVDFNENSLYNITIAIQFESTSTATLNGVKYNCGEMISSDGEYVFELDRTGVKINYTFIIDKTAPTGTLEGVTDAGCTNSNVSFSWIERSATATLNGEAYLNGTTIRAEGEYTIVLTDRAGNSSTYNFIIDRVPPVGTLIGAENGGFTNTDVSFIWNDSAAHCALNGAEYLSGTTIEKEGKYTIVLTDSAGNSSTYSFTIDKTPPTLIIKDKNGNQIHNIRFNCDFTICTDDNVYDIIYVNSSLYQANTLISTENYYSIYAVDRAGNCSNTVDVVLYRAIPMGTLGGVTIGGLTNSNVIFTWDAEDEYTALLNGESYASGTTICAEGEYTIVLSDDIGNINTYTFIIDKTAPIGELEGVTDAGCTNGNVSFSWTERSATATLNGEAYLSGTTIRAEGEYTIVLTDRAGNSSTYSFVIIRVAPIGTLIGAENGGFTSLKVSFVWEDLTAHCALNGAEYLSGTTIEEEGEYIIILTDLAGNSSKYSFTIDKTAPMGKLEGVKENGFAYNSASFTWTERSATATLNGEAYLSGTTIRAEGEYTIVLTDRAGNSSTYSFTIYKQLPSANYSNETKEGTLQDKKSYFGPLTITVTENESLYVNEKLETSGVIIENSGEYFIKVVNIAGDEISYTITIKDAAAINNTSEQNATNVIATILLTILGIVMGVIVIIGVARTIKRNKQKII